MAPSGGYLRPGEEDWQGVFQNLCERFPSFAPERVAQILRDNEGHAGQAAASLRDLSSTSMRPVDPDDAEHVKTLLSSPQMFAHACKEHFQKFDTNRNGLLEWVEVLALTNSLYEALGLQPPREGALRKFFEASDVNGDGVLTEEEFKVFFEKFLRYAFLEVEKHGSGQLPPVDPSRHRHREQRDHREAQRAEHHHGERGDSRGAERERRTERDRRSEHRGGDAGRAARESPPEASPPAETRQNGRRSQTASAGVGLRCVAPNGVTYRRTANFDDRSSSRVQRGEQIQVLEHWVRTSEGWLPLTDSNNHPLFEPVGGPKQEAARSSEKPGSREGKRHAERHAERHADNGGGSSAPASQDTGAGRARAAAEAPSGGLRQGEEEWEERFERLCERFPSKGPSAVAQALRDHGGHAGKAATQLRA